MYFSIWNQLAHAYFRIEISRFNCLNLACFWKK